MTIYVDSKWAGESIGTFEKPYRNTSQFTLNSGETVLCKRGSVFHNGAWVINKREDVTIGSYGDDESPPVFQHLLYDNNPLLWVEVEPNIWRRDTLDMGSGNFVILQAGTDLQPNQIRTDDNNVLERNGDWNGYGVNPQTTGYILMYCEQNPVIYFGFVAGYNNTGACIQFNKSSGTIEDIKCTYAAIGIDASVYSGEVVSVKIRRCEFDNVWKGIWIRNDHNNDSLYTQDCEVSDCLLTNSRSVGISILGHHRNLIIERNKVFDTGNQNSIAGIYTQRTYGTPEEPIIIRQNLVDNVYYGAYWIDDGDGIYNDHEGSNVHVYSNEVRNIQGQGAGLRSNSSGPGYKWYWNIADNCAYGALWSYSNKSGGVYGLEGHENLFSNCRLAGWEVRRNAIEGIINMHDNIFTGKPGSLVGNNVDNDATVDVHKARNTYYGFNEAYRGQASPGKGDNLESPIREGFDLQCGTSAGSRKNILLDQYSSAQWYSNGRV